MCTCVCTVVSEGGRESSDTSRRDRIVLQKLGHESDATLLKIFSCILMLGKGKEKQLCRNMIYYDTNTNEA